MTSFHVVLISECIANKATQAEHVMFMYIHVHGHTYCTCIHDLYIPAVLQYMVEPTLICAVNF